MFQFPIHQTARHISFSLFSLPQLFQQPNNEKIEYKNKKENKNPCFRVSFVLPWREPDRELRVRPWGAWSRRRPPRPPSAACFGWKPNENPSFWAQTASDMSELCSSSSAFEKWERKKESLSSEARKVCLLFIVSGLRVIWIYLYTSVCSLVGNFLLGRES